MSEIGFKQLKAISASTGTIDPGPGGLCFLPRNVLDLLGS